MKMTDPVCRKEIELEESLPRAEHGDWVYFFCSGACRSRFLEDPDRFAVSPRLAATANAGTGRND